jgi:hypothetical protein
MLQLRGISCGLWRRVMLLLHGCPATVYSKEEPLTQKGIKSYLLLHEALLEARQEVAARDAAIAQVPNTIVSITVHGTVVHIFPALGALPRVFLLRGAVRFRHPFSR